LYLNKENHLLQFPDQQIYKTVKCRLNQMYSTTIPGN